MAASNNSFIALAPGIMVRDNGATITLEVTKDPNPQPSASGKSVVVASTRGNVKLGDLSIGLNMYKPVAK